jgi:hypothetical protein
MEDIKASIVRDLTRDTILCSFWSGEPECNIYSHEDSDYFKHVQVTVFLKEYLINAVNVGGIVKRMAKLVRPHIQFVDELCAFAGWIGGGDTSDKYFRVLRFSVLKEAMESPLLDSLSSHFGEEYFNERGVSFLRYYPLR